MDSDHSGSEPFDPFAYAKLLVQNQQIEDEGEHEGSGQKCEIAVLESRYNRYGEQLPLQVATVRQPQPKKQVPGFAHYSALVLTKHFDKLGNFTGTILEIKSPHVIKALRDVIKSYPEVEFGTKRVLINGLPQCIFHYRNELQQYGRNIHNAEAAQHLLYTLSYMYSFLENQLMSYYLSVEMDPEAPSLEFVNLWMVFRPGDIIYSNTGTSHRLYRLKSFTIGILQVESISFDGQRFGYISSSLSISPYNNLRKIRDLSAFPFRYHQDARAVKTSLLARAKRFVGLAGIHYRAYDGYTQSFREFEDGVDDEDVHTQSRIMIDHGFYARDKCAAFGHLERYIPSSNSETEPELPDEELMLCSHEVPAFVFATKTWRLLEIDKIREMEFNTTAFANLLLPPGQKEIIQSLVEVHLDKRSISNDFIKGKSRGLVIMLYGVPGVGKTLTAEIIAEHTRRPLYVVNCGDLGTDPAQIEKNFRSKSRQAVAWNAVMLIDEVDMFLEKRRAHELQRNALVSVFLRILEYFQGILFLTTNRITACDPAIKARIDLVIKYETLSISVRRDLFEAFIRRSCPTYDPEVLDDGFLEQLAGAELNGREIKNVVRMAQALALTAKSRMGKGHLKTASDVMTKSTADLAHVEKEGRYDSMEFAKESKRRLHSDSEIEDEEEDEFSDYTPGPKRRRLS